MYAYDAAGRLVGVTDPSGQTARYRYDAAGNRLGIDRYPSSKVSVLSVVPVSAAPGAKVTLSGTGFSSTSSANKVTMGGKPATVASATKTRLVVKVPKGAAHGRVSVEVAAHTAVADETFLSAPAAPLIRSFQPNKGPAGSLVRITGSGFATKPAANTVRIGGVVAEATASTTSTLSVRVPPGALDGPVEVETAGGASTSSESFTVTAGDAGVVEMTVSTSLTDNTPPKVKITTPGNLAKVLFEAKRGDVVDFGFTESTFNGLLHLSLLDPQGNEVGGRGYIQPEGGAWEVRKLPTGGRYALLVDTGEDNLGEARVTVSRPADAGELSTSRAAVRGVMARHGQAIEAAFTASAGADLSLGVTASTFKSTVWVDVLAPAGARIVTMKSVTAGRPTTIALPDVPKTGSYTVAVYSLDAATGALDLTLSADTRQTLLADKDPVTVRIARPGQRLRAEFTAPSDGVLGFAVTDNTISRGATLTLVGPAGGQGKYLDLLSAARDGTTFLSGLVAGAAYAIVIEPDDAATGQATLWLSRPVRVGTLSPLTATSGEINRPGQQLDFVVNAVAGGGAALAVDGITFGLTRAMLRAPGASEFTPAGWMSQSGEVSLRAPLASGTHHLLLQPDTPVAGKAIVTLLPDARGGVLTVGGPRRPAEVTAQGQHAQYTFRGTAGQRLMLDVGASPSNWRLFVHGPDGTWLVDDKAVGDAEAGVVLPALAESGTYTLTAEPENRRVGTFSLGLKATLSTTERPDQPVERLGPAYIKNDFIPWLVSWLKDAFDWLSGDPVSLGTGLLVDRRTDLAVSGGLGNAEVTRTYWQGDTHVRAFGVGRDLSYNVMIYSNRRDDRVDLYLPGGAVVRYVRTTPGSSDTNAVFEARDTPTEFYQSEIVYRTGGWDLRFRDGTTWGFSRNGTLMQIRDRLGNPINLKRLNGDRGELTRIDAPGGRWISLAYDSRRRVRQARDNTGRVVGYGYDSENRLISVTDVAGKVSRYTYDGESSRVSTATDSRGITYLASTYYGDGRVKTQTLPEGAVYHFAYTDQDGRIAATQVTEPDGAVRRVEFDSDGFAVSDTQAWGTPLARRTSYERGASHRIDAAVDPYGRRTELTYDTHGHITSGRELAGTAQARDTGTAKFDGPFDQPTRITDLQGHVTLFRYDTSGNLKKVTDPEGRQTDYTYTPQGQVRTVTDAAKAVTTYRYRHGDLVSATDAQGRTGRRVLDGAGRVTQLTDEAGAVTTITYDVLNQPRAVTDPLGHSTAYL